MKLRLALTTLLATASLAFAEGKLVQLILSSRKLDPTTTFEVRFPEAMVAADRIGQQADSPPVAFRPAVKGHFTWLSERSGVFAPDEALPLSTTFQFGLAPGVLKADGSPLVAEFRETLQTPPMQIKGWNAPRGISSENATAEPLFTLLFNVNVDSATAVPFCKFADKSGNEVAACVVAADPKRRSEESFPSYRSSDGSLLTWAERFTAKGADADAGPRGNHLFITPVQPLPTGEDWALVVESGLPAREGGLRLIGRVAIPIGRVVPFDLMSAEAANAIGHGRRIELSFTKQLAKEINENNLKRWVRLDPQPKNLHARLSDWRIEFTGDFEVGKTYALHIDAGMPAAEPFVLAAAVDRKLVFEQVPSRLYFKEFSTHQLTTGRRQFHLLSINVPRMKISAKVFPSDTLAAALSAYEKYTAYDSRGDTGYAKVDPDDLPGQVVWQREFVAKAAIDEQETITLDWNEILGAKQTGAVLLTAEQIGEPTGTEMKRPGAQSLVQLTDLGVVWKTSASEFFVHVFSLASANPVADATLRIVDKTGAVLAEAKSDESGIARLPVIKEAAWLLAETSGDRHLVDFLNGEGSVNPTRLHLRRHFDDEEEEDISDRPTFLFTERPVYKPGEMLHLKGIARDWREGYSRIPAGVAVRLTAHDAKGRVFFTKDTKLSDTGAIGEDVKLPDGVLGTYRIELAYLDEKANADAAASHEFEVQEYRPNAFEISIGGPKKAVGEAALELPVSAKYYMGKTLSKAALSWSIEASDEGFSPAGFGDFAFCNDIADYRVSELLQRSGHFAQQGKADLDENGAAMISVIVPVNTKAPQPRTTRVLCEITDLDQQTVSESSIVSVHPSDFYLGIKRPKSVVREGETLPVEVIAITPDATPMSEPVTATLRLTRIDWQTNRIEGAGRTDEYRNEPRLVLVSTTTVSSRGLAKKDGKWIAADEAAPTAALIAGKPGEYLLEAVTKDAAGRDVLTTLNFHVYGTTETTWNYRNPYEIELVADKVEYLAGQTATLLVKTPIQGEALVTIEREKVLRSFVTKLRGNAPSVSIPLEDLDAPNVFVSVMMLRGADKSPRKSPKPEYRLGYCELKVARPDAKLRVYVQPDEKAYRPGANVNVATQVIDAAGNPVANAEVTLYAVDEGVLSLMGHETPNPLLFFNRERFLAVRTALTLPSLLSENADDRHYGNKGYLIGGGGESGDTMRKNFLACAFWNAALRTDEAGRIATTFTAPDSLTRYRVIAVAQTARDQFGSAESAFEVNKPLMLEPSLPRFANVGDRLLLRAVLHNMTDFAGEAEIALELDDTAHADSKTRRVSLPARGSLAIDFPVEFTEVGKAVWKWTATLVSADAPTAFRDAVQTELNVGFPAPLLREVRTSRTDDAETTLLDTIDPQLLEGRGTVRVSVSNSRLLELRESLRELLHYPYGCVEQTTSSTLPWMTLRDMRDAVPELKKTNAEIDDAVNHGVDRLLKMQTDSGGLAYWPGESQPLFWGSAYGGLGLAIARQKGFTVPGEEFDRLMKYLSEQLRGSGGDRTDLHYSGGGPTDRCLAVYALAVAGRAEPAYHELLFKNRASLSAENRALLALAIAESGGDARMIAELLAERAEEAETDRWFGSRSRTLAVRMLAWSKSQPAAPVVDELVAQLFGERRGGHWQTTQGNAWTLLAMSDYVKRTESSHRAFSGSLSWGGQKTDFDLGSRPQMTLATFALNPKDARTPLKLSNPGKSRMFTEVTVEARPRLIAQPAQDRGYSIQRSYRKIADDGSLAEFKDARVGDRVLVQLDIEVRREAGYIAVDDPLPSIFEAVNPAFKSQEAVGERITRDWVSDHHELREDRALFFADNIQPGRYTIRYLARVSAAGTATAPAAKIEEMYHPERGGLTATSEVTSVALK